MQRLLVCHAFDSYTIRGRCNALSVPRTPYAFFEGGAVLQLRTRGQSPYSLSGAPGGKVGNRPLPLSFSEKFSHKRTLKSASSISGNRHLRAQRLARIGH
jgi:hypothetical protein